MLLKDISLKTPPQNIFYDDVLLHLAEKGHGGEVLRFWESPEYFVVLGRISKENEDIKKDEVCKDRIPILRRSSGGGTVLQGKGCLNYSLVLSKEHNSQIADLRRSYQMILGKVVAALRQLGVESMFAPVSDIALVKDSKKISGNAQKRSKKFVLHHGTLLYDFDLQKIEHYLKMPNAMPEYRQGRTHSDFVTNIPVSVEDIKNTLKKAFEVNSEETCLNDDERNCLREFLNTKNAQVDLCIGQ